MTTTSSSGLSPEAKEFIPLVQNPAQSIPLYVDENTVASMYPSDQQPLMLQSIYPLILTNSKVTDNIQFPEIEFHIQPSQQQQFHIDSSANIQQQHQSSTNGSTSSTNTSQIVLLPITNPTNTVTLTGYYPESHVIYSTNEQVSAYYPIDYCEQPLINFSLQHPTSITKSNRISPQQQRSSSFRQHYGMNYSVHRPALSRGGNRGFGYNNNNISSRNPYYDYSNRRNGSSYTQTSGRGSSSNSKRVSTSYHSNDHNNYYHGSRPRGYAPRSSHQHDERRKDHYHDYYNHDNDSQQVTNVNDDGISFEFRPEDFPSLPINNQPDKSSSPVNIASISSKPTSSWNAIVSASRRRSTSPQSIPQSQDQRSDRSRSFNNKPSLNNERKSSIKKSQPQTTRTTKSANSASKTKSYEDQQHSQCLNINNSSMNETNDSRDDGFIQTKQQHRRLKRKNKNKEEQTAFTEPTNDSAPYMLEDENTFPTLGQNPMSESLIHKHDSNQELFDNKSNQTSLTEMFNSLSASTQVKQEKSNNKSITTSINNSANSFDAKSNSKPMKERKSRKLTKLKCSINKDFEENQNQRQTSLAKLSNENNQTEEKHIQNETDTNTTNINEIDHQNSNPLSSSSSNSSDTSDYDDAVDKFDDE